jgi:hypothetical protein
MRPPPPPPKFNKDEPDISESGMSIQEIKVLNLTAELWNSYTELPELHPMDKQEFCLKIHDIQRCILARPTLAKLTESSPLA